MEEVIRRRVEREKHEHPTPTRVFWLGRGNGENRLSEFFTDRTTNDWGDTDSAEESIAEEEESSTESSEIESRVEESSDEVSGE